MVPQRDEGSDLRIAPIVLGVLALMFLIVIAGQVIGQHLGGGAPASPPPAAAKADPAG